MNSTENKSNPTGSSNSSTESEKKNEALERYQVRRDAMNEIDISLVLERLGADNGQDGDRTKWKIPGFGNIITQGQRWKNVNTNVHKGFGGVRLVQYAKDFEREGEALRWMEQQFGPADKIDNSIKAADSGRKKDRSQFFDPPQVMDHVWDRVRDYLTNQRGIPSSLVDKMHEAGTLYGNLAFHEIQKRHYGSPRAIFLGPSSAEIREITPDGFKGCATGSDPDNSCFHVPHYEDAEESILAIQEAAVDSLSYSALFPGRYSVSTNGVGRFQLQYRLCLEAIESQYGVSLAFDADQAGDLGAQHVFNGIFTRILLSRRLDVPYETIDQWLMSGAVDVTPIPSPHQTFFSEGWKPSLMVHERSQETDAEGKIREKWMPTSNNAPPTVRMTVRAGLHAKLDKRVYDVPVSERAFQYITEGLRLIRERPIMGKDWNDELRKLGSAYLMSYEREAKKGFVNGVPALPLHLEKLRTPGIKVIAAPHHAPLPQVKVEASLPSNAPTRPSFQP